MFGLKKAVGNLEFGRFLRATRSIFSSVKNQNGRIINPGIRKDSVLWKTGGQEIKLTRHHSCQDPCAYTKLMDINCKTALITGGATGIGLAIADALLCSGLQKAYIAGRNTCNGAKAVMEMTRKHGGGRCEYIQLDVNNHKHFEDAFRDIVCRDGSVDILINNAGMLNDKHWEAEIDTNVKGVMQGILLANKYMPSQKNRGGCVVNVASILGYDTFPFAPAYTSTKHAVVGLTKCFGDPVHYRSSGVRIICVGPGVTHTVLISGSASIQLNEEWGRKTFEAVQSLPAQSTDAVGSGVVFMVEYGPPGSLWVVEDRKLQRVIPPDRKTYQTKVLDL